MTDRPPPHPPDTDPTADGEVSAAGGHPGSQAIEELSPTQLVKLKVKIPGYTLQSVLGRGGQATVYRARENSSGLTVAVKVLHSGLLADEIARVRMRREIATLKALSHPNIVCVIDSGSSDDGHEYLVMNYVEGRDLAEYIVESRATPGESSDPAAVLVLFKKICDAVNAAHRAGITHRDLSPGNIRIDPTGEPHILDFGLARTAFDRLISRHGGDVSVTGQFLGKLAYASPEQASCGPAAIDIRTDVYALGVILYEIITHGQFPYEVVGNLLDVLKNIAYCKPTPPSKAIEASESGAVHANRRLKRRHPPEVNPAIEAIVLKALEKDPANRYQSAGDLARDIDRYLSGLPIIAHVTPTANSPTEPPARDRSPRRRIATLATAVTLVLTGGAWYGLHAIRAGETPTGGRGEVSTAVGTSNPTRPADASPATPDAATPNRPEPPWILGGSWRIEGDELVQAGLETETNALVFGDRTWSDYDLSFKGLSFGGRHGFKAFFHFTDPANYCAFAVGNYYNAGHDLSFHYGGEWGRHWNMYTPAKIEFNRWYDVQIRVRGSEFWCYLDGTEWFHDKDRRFTHGRIALAAWAARVRFKDIQVTAPDGRVLWAGLPRPTTSNK